MSNAQQAEQELDDDLNDELEIEIVDDVEEDDKPRVSEKDYTGPEIPEDDEIESYSERVQKRMKKLSFEAKEAERQRQALAREREELLRVSQTFHSENEKLRQQLYQNEGTLVAQAKARLEAQLAQAKASYKEAYELGDTEKMIEAQEKLTSLNNDMYRVNNYKPRPAQPAQQPAPQAVQQAERPQAPKLDERQEKWLSDNDWYGKDRQMTAFALGVHEELVYNGVDPNSDKYYTEINSAVRKRFADKFEDDLEEVEVAPKKKANVVAPATRSSKNPQKVKLTQTQVALAKRLGLTPQQYAAQLLKEQLNG
jgi:hypothetical protein